jgi:hypothetical protein
MVKSKAHPSAHETASNPVRLGRNKIVINRAHLVLLPMRWLGMQMGIWIDTPMQCRLMFQMQIAWEIQQLKGLSRHLSGLGLQTAYN